MKLLVKNIHFENRINLSCPWNTLLKILQELKLAKKIPQKASMINYFILKKGMK